MLTRERGKQRYIIVPSYANRVGAPNTNGNGSAKPFFRCERDRPPLRSSFVHCTPMQNSALASNLSYLRHLRAQSVALLWHTFCGHSTTANILFVVELITPPILYTTPKVSSAAAIMVLASAVVVPPTMYRHAETLRRQYWSPKLTTSLPTEHLIKALVYVLSCPCRNVSCMALQPVPEKYGFGSCQSALRRFHDT